MKDTGRKNTESGQKASKQALEDKYLGKHGEYSVAKLKTFDTPDGGGYNCDLLRNGKKVASVHEAGHGGEPEFCWADGKYHGKMAEDFEAYAKSLPPYYSEILGKSMQIDGELLIAELVEREETRKWLKRRVGKKVLFRKPDMPDGEWHTMSLQGNKFSSAIADQFRKAYGDNIIIANELFMVAG